MSHSPASWEIRELTCEDHRGMGWVEDANGRDIACCGAQELWQEENRSNARLIAAAPDLLQALQMFVSCAIPVSTEIDPVGHTWVHAYLNEVLPIARKTIKKATGDINV